MPSRQSSANPDTPTASDRIASLEAKAAQQRTQIDQLQAKIASLPVATPPKDYSKDIQNIQAKLDDMQNQLQDVLAEVDDRLAEWEKEQGTSSSSGGSGDDIEVNITQPYMSNAIPALAAGQEYTQTIPLTLTLENTLKVTASNIIITVVALPQTSRQYPSMTITLIGGLLFNSYAANQFQSWGPLSLKAQQKKTYQLSVNVTLKNTGTTAIDTGTLTIPMQAYCVDFDT